MSGWLVAGDFLALLVLPRSTSSAHWLLLAARCCRSLPRPLCPPL
jgi:hypothetical protein